MSNCVCSTCGISEGSERCKSCYTLYINWIPRKKDIVIYGLKEAREIKEMLNSKFLKELKELDVMLFDEISFDATLKIRIIIEKYRVKTL